MIWETKRQIKGVKEKSRLPSCGKIKKADSFSKQWMRFRNRCLAVLAYIVSIL